MFLILRMVYMFVFHGVEEDIRSDKNDETAGDSDVVTPSNTSDNGHTNGTISNGKTQDGISGKSKSA